MTNYKQNGFKALEELISGETPNGAIHLPTQKLEEVFSGVTPEIIEAVEENEFDELKEVSEWSKRNLGLPEESAKKEMSLLVESGIIGHPEEMGDCDEGLITHRDEPIQVQGDVILSIGFSRKQNHLQGLPEKEEKKNDFLELQYIEYTSEDKEDLKKMEVLRVDEEKYLKDYITDLSERENLELSDSSIENLILVGKLEKPHYNLKVIG